jgi:AcrR family transcriptional regulator
VTDVNGGRRTYASALRRRQAAATRAAVLTAARDLFLAQGFGATTVEQIADRAGVSKPTVFSAVGNKQTLLKVVRDVAMAGDDEPVPVFDRPNVQVIEREPDVDRAVELFAGHVVALCGRYAGIDAVLRGAAESGEDGPRALWRLSEDQRLAGARRWLEILEAKGAVALERDTAVDELWLLMAPELYRRLVGDRGWDVDHFRRWLAGRIRTLFA